MLLVCIYLEYVLFGRWLIECRCLFVAFGKVGDVVDDESVWEVAVPADWGVGLHSHYIMVCSGRGLYLRLIHF